MRIPKWRNPASVVLVLVLMIASTGSVAAQANSCRVVVQPGDTLYSLARRFDTSVFQIVHTNKLTNPDLILAGDELFVPIGFNAEEECTADSIVTDAAPLAPAAPATPTSMTTSTSTTTTTTQTPTFDPGSYTVELGTPLYAGDGTWVEIPVTVHNHSVTPAIAGGKYNTDQKPDGNYEDVTLVKAFHGEFETPLVSNALLWQANVHMSDGSTHLATVGCRFIEHVFAEGDEPLERDEDGNWIRSFHYEINLYDGWFDCGNTYRVNPENIIPGTSATSILNVYLVNPHYLALDGSRVGDPYPERRLTQLDVTVFTPTGDIVGTQTLAVPSPATTGQ